MKYIYLQDRYRSITITDEAYEQIVRLVRENAICGTCKQPYSDSFPCFHLNCCLVCFMKQENYKHLSFMDIHYKHPEGDYTCYRFMDRQGYIILTYSNSDRDVSRSEYDTIIYYGFHVPTVYQKNGEEKKLSSSYWRIHGKFRQNTAIVVEYIEFYGDCLRIAFISWKDGRLTEVNKRKGYIKALFARARAVAETTKDASGAYHIYEYSTYQLSDSSLYEVISDLLTRGFEPETQKNENSQKRMVTPENAHEVWRAENHPEYGGEWTWYVLKKYQNPEQEEKNRFARWHCLVTSPIVPHGEQGDVYITEIKAVAHQIDNPKHKDVQTTDE